MAYYTLQKQLIMTHKGKEIFNLLKPTGHVMHHQFNIQQLYALPTLYLCVLFLSENNQRLVRSQQVSGLRPLTC